MDYKQIQDLIKLINKSNISEITIEEENFAVTIKQHSPQSGQGQYAPMQPIPFQHAPQQMQTLALHGPVAAAVQEPINQMPLEKPGKANENTIVIKSPMIGTFYRSPGPDKAPFVQVGDEIKQGEVICVIEAMKLFNEIESEVSGRVVKVLADDASPVEYDQPLFVVEPA